MKRAFKVTAKVTDYFYKGNGKEIGSGIEEITYIGNSRTNIENVGKATMQVWNKFEKKIVEVIEVKEQF